MRKIPFAQYFESRVKLAGTTQHQVRLRMDISDWALRRRKVEPESMTLRELKQMNAAVGISPLIALEIAGYTRKDLEQALKGDL